MSLSTLLEAAKYLDYLDSNKNGQQQPQTSPYLQVSTQQAPPNERKSSRRRHRSSRKDAANTMVAMSLPAPSQMQHSVPIPLASSSHHNHATSLSSSFTTGSPLSSFASTALLCSKVSGVTSNSSSTASSLSSSDSSSSCGEILMGDNDCNHSSLIERVHDGQHPAYQQLADIDHQQLASNQHQEMLQKSFARYIAATSSGPQLVTMTTTSAGLISTSAPIDGRLRAGHVMHTASNHAGSLLNTGTDIDPCNFPITAAGRVRSDGMSYGLTTTGKSLGSDTHLSGSSNSSHPPLIMARVQPMILNSLSPSTHQGIVAFQPPTGSSPTSSSSSYSRHRELHKTLEKNRRAHLRHCFELLKTEMPISECADKKTSHINIIKSAIRYVLALQQQECEIDSELQRLTRRKNELTEKLSLMSIGTNGNEHMVSNPTVLKTPVTKFETDLQMIEQQSTPQQPAEQQLSFLLSQSKID